MLVTPLTELLDTLRVARENTGVLRRGEALFFSFKDLSMVHKVYQRGGLIGRLVSNWYVFNGHSRTRMSREFELLVKLRESGLTVPEPLLAKYSRSLLLFYRGELITRRIEHAQTLAEILVKQELSAALWQKVGGVLARFHRHGVYHADLNASNIMIDDREVVWLIDFDKGAIDKDVVDKDVVDKGAIKSNRVFNSLQRPRQSPGWRAGNLSRLQRSLKKYKANLPRFSFNEQDWHSFMVGYGEPSVRGSLQ